VANRITPPSPLNPFLDDAGMLSSEARSWTQIITARSLIIGTGNPNGIIEAQQGAEYMDDNGTAGNIKYIKRNSDVSGDKTLGWYLI
jgi:hypothetical protein